MSSNLGAIVLFRSGDGRAELDVQLKNETVWLSQAQMTELFQRDQSVISRHVNNVFKEGELPREGNMQKMHIANSDKPVTFFNLDVVISVGYRVKSKYGTQFRIWATSVLKDHLVKGYSLNKMRLAETGVTELGQILSLLSTTLKSHELVNDEGLAVLDIIGRYADTWRLLLQYDEDKLEIPKHRQGEGVQIDLDSTRYAVLSLKNALLDKGEATELFGQERGEGLAGIIGAIYQTFGGHDLYPSVAEKAANLLYFVIKDHPFSDGNKRIGTFLLVLFLDINGRFFQGNFSNKALVALTLLTATSDPSHKDLLVRLIVNLLTETGDTL